MNLVCGLDIGTSGAKAIAVDASGNVLAKAEQAFTHPPYQPAPGLAEQNALEWWQAGSACLRNIIQQLPSARIIAISVDSTSGTIVPVDRSGAPLMNAMMYNDGRAKGLEAEVNAAAAEITALLGYGFSSTFALVKLLWLKKNRPEIVDAAHKFLHAADFVASRLTGDLNSTDTSNALKSGVNLTDGTWPAYIEERLGLPLEKFPRAAKPGDKIGEVSAQAASETGLEPGTTVIAGASDGTAAFFASGAEQLGDWNINIGTTIAIRGISNALIRDFDGRLYCHRHPEEHWLPGGASNVGGESLKSVFGPAKTAELDQQIDPTTPSSLLVYPLIRQGERMPFASPDAQGFMIGEPNDEGERFKGYLEGIALITAWSIAEAAVLGAAVNGNYFFSGGASRGTAIKTILASALNRPLRLTNEPEAAFGSALLAAGWAWHDGSVSRAQQHMVHITHIIDPVPDLIAPLNDKLEDLKTQCYQRGYL